MMMIYVGKKSMDDKHLPCAWVILNWSKYQSPKMTPIKYLITASIFMSLCQSTTGKRKLVPPIVINTWNFTNANSRAWQELALEQSALDAIELGCGQCEIDRCDGTVGWGGSPAESGETTLDAMIMDGESYNIGGVGGLRRIKNAIGVARQVLDRTNHTLLVGDMATQFALELGFKDESLTSNESIKIHQDWLANSCQPNYWVNVEPDPRRHCGPYRIPTSKRVSYVEPAQAAPYYDVGLDHDTIGMVAVDSKGRFAAGTSTNGLKNKILGRVGDSPVPGSGCYAAKEAGAAAATGDGDVIMRFLLSYQAVENLRRGMTAEQSALDVIDRFMNRTGKPYPEAAVIVLALDGGHGAACTGFKTFPHVISDSREQIKTIVVECFN